MRAIRHWFVVAACMVSPASGVAQEKYYAVFYAGQNGGPRLSHSWATFVKVTEQTPVNSDGESDLIVEQHTISWLPVSGVVNIRLLGGGEPGRNYSLSETLEWCQRNGMAVRAWPPVEISKELFDLAVLRKSVLDSGRVLYRALDRRGRGAWSNCIHALTDIRPASVLYTGTAYGEPATAQVVSHLRSYFIEPEKSHAWVLDYLETGTVAASGPSGGRPIETKEDSPGERVVRSDSGEWFPF